MSGSRTPSLQIVEHDDARHSRRGGGTLARAAPPRSARARVQGQQAHRLAAEAERQHEEPRAPVLARLRVAHHRPVAVVDLGLFARRGLDHGTRARESPRRAASARSAARSRSRARSRGRRPGPGRSPSRCGRAPAPPRSARGTARRHWPRGCARPRPVATARRSRSTPAMAAFAPAWSRWTPALAGFAVPGSVDTSIGRFWRRAPIAPGRGRDPRRLQIRARRLAPHPRRLLDAPQRPAQPPQRQDLLLASLSLKTFAIPAAGPRLAAPRQRLERLPRLAGFQVSINGRFWVSTEVPGTRSASAMCPKLCPRLCPKRYPTSPQQPKSAARRILSLPCLPIPPRGRAESATNERRDCARIAQPCQPAGPLNGARCAAIPCNPGAWD